MGMRDLALGLGGGLLVATLVFGAADALLPKDAAQTPSPAPSAEQQEPNQEQKPDTVELPKAEYEKKLAEARAEGAKQKADELAGQKQAAPNQVYVYIQPGMGTTDVAILLQGAGVLSDGNELIQLRQQQSNPIRSGTYLLPVKGNAKDVLKMIATPPKY